MGHRAGSGLRIIPDALWVAVRTRLEGIKQRLEDAAGRRLGGRRRDIDSRYLIRGSRAAVSAVGRSAS